MSALTYVELIGSVQEEPFTNLLLEVSETTVDTGLEAGFAMYRSPDGPPFLSDMLHPDEEYQDAMQRAEAQRLQRQHYLAEVVEGALETNEDELFGRMPQIKLGQLITDENVQLRTDLAMVVHSHPLTHMRQREPRRMLLPSSRDLINFSEHATANPGLIEGTLATHSKLGGIALLLWRASTPDAIQNVQSLEEGAHIDDHVLATLGLHTATVAFSRRTGRVRSGLPTLAHLFDET